MTCHAGARRERRGMTATQLVTIEAFGKGKRLITD